MDKSKHTKYKLQELMEYGYIKYPFKKENNNKNYKQMKAKVKRLLELLEHNTHSLWDTNLRYTTDCIILEDKELKDMVYEEDTEESDFKNHIFNGNELCKLIEELKKEL